MRISRQPLIIIATVLLLLAVPQSLFLPIRNTALLGFCWGEAAGGEAPTSWALEQEAQALRAELKQLRSVLSLSEDHPLRLPLAAALPAAVVYRGPSTWNSSLWVGAGEVSNRGRSEPIVAKGSPVVLGRALVGVVDYVGKRRSRVALISDPRLHPAVQAVRGNTDALLPHLTIIANALTKYSDYAELRDNIAILDNHFQKNRNNEIYLAKGELSGAAHTLWRSHQRVLKGVGFEGEPSVEVGDLLVTTGLDGVFPSGLEVGHVVEVGRPHRGSSSWELQALPAAGDLESVKTLFILAPQPTSD